MDLDTGEVRSAVRDARRVRLAVPPRDHPGPAAVVGGQCHHTSVRANPRPPETFASVALLHRARRRGWKSSPPLENESARVRPREPDVYALRERDAVRRPVHGRGPGTPAGDCAFATRGRSPGEWPRAKSAGPIRRVSRETTLLSAILSQPVGGARRCTVRDHDGNVGRAGNEHPRHGRDGSHQSVLSRRATTRQLRRGRPWHRRVSRSPVPPEWAENEPPGVGRKRTAPPFHVKQRRRSARRRRDQCRTCALTRDR